MRASAGLMFSCPMDRGPRAELHPFFVLYDGANMPMDIATTHNHEHSPDLLRRLADGDPVEMREVREARAPDWSSYQDGPALAAFLRLLGDTTRLRILFLLVGGEQSVTELCRELSVAQPTVSHHLAWLRTAGLVVFRRHAKHVFYALGPEVAAEGDWLSFGKLRVRLGRDAWGERNR